MVNKHSVYNVGLKESEKCPLPSHRGPKLPLRTPNDNQPVTVDPRTGQLYSRDPQVIPYDLEKIIENTDEKITNLREEVFDSALKLPDTVLEKVTDPNIIYGNDKSGNPIGIPYGENVAEGVVTRDKNKQITVPTPTANQHATNKEYVDGKITELNGHITDTYLPKSNASHTVYGVDNVGQQENIFYSPSSEDNPLTIVQRDDTGHIDVLDPTSANHATNKNYVDLNFVNSNKVKAEATANTIPMRDSGGRIITNAPTADSHAVNKSYLDQKIKEVQDSIVGDLSLAYDTYTDFISSVATKTENGKKVLVSITNETETKTYTSDKIPLGTQILLREQSVDYWLSKKEIAENEDVINFFTPFEGEVNLDNYYTKTETEKMLEELADNTQANFKQLTGAEIENGTFEDGEIIYCTLNSDFFTANTYYVYIASNSSFRPISMSTAIQIKPSISSFTVTTNPASVSNVEVGRTIYITRFDVGLKKYSDFAYLTFTHNNGTITETSNITSNSVSVTGLNYAIKSTSTGAISVSVTGRGADNNVIASADKTLGYYVQRQYYGIAPDNPDLEVMTSALATQYYKNIVSSTNEIKTYLQSAKPSSITLNLSDTSTYVWFIIPTHLSISKMTSGGFDFPFVTQSNVTITNQYGVDITYKVYRSVNKIYGTTTINLS